MLTITSRLVEQPQFSRKNQQGNVTTSLGPFSLDCIWATLGPFPRQHRITQSAPYRPRYSRSQHRDFAAAGCKAKVRSPAVSPAPSPRSNAAAAVPTHQNHRSLNVTNKFHPVIGPAGEPSPRALGPSAHGHAPHPSAGRCGAGSIVINDSTCHLQAGDPRATGSGCRLHALPPPPDTHPAHTRRLKEILASARYGVSLLERTLRMGRRSISSSEVAAINVGGRSRVARRAAMEKDRERGSEREAAEKGRRGEEEAHTGRGRGRGGEEGKGDRREGKRGKRKKRREKEREQRREKGEGRERKSVKDLRTGVETGLALACTQESPWNPSARHRTKGSVLWTDTPLPSCSPSFQPLAQIG
ncbi:hypothetical protein TREES_T100000125 [Tupaia chinensis]|uniref:Uncharacterized protein n=1 Tax=Tupaia chinensis TaxID=246437 RepID=L9LA00_TUPCH|nr:hypothetical protein TREES_T100000125 [Tupaia chinensis]